MIPEIQIRPIAARIAVAGALVIVGTLLGYFAVANFVVSALSDERAAVDRATLTAAVRLFPDSPRLQARLAASAKAERDFINAETHAERALTLSPYNYSFHLLLASIKESRGDMAAAEQTLREAARLAPNKTEPHWQLANLLLRAGKRNEALGEFRVATSMNSRLLPVTLNIIWRATNENLDAIDAVAAGDAKSRLALATFLLKQSRPLEAARVFRAVDYNARRPLAQSRDLIRSMAAVDAALARDLWADLLNGNNGERPLLWNGGFEAELTKEFSQYDWVLGRSEFARIRVMGNAAHSGAHALRVDFLGRDTTVMEGEIRQTVVLRPGARYRLTCYAKAENLLTAEGPRIAVATKAAPAWLAQSEPLAASQAGWQLLTVEFNAPSLPAGVQPAFEVSVRRKPKFSYDEPTSGSVWFDDFALTEVKP